MKAIELLKIMAVGMKILSRADIKTEDFRHIDLYDDYQEMRANGEKYDNAVRELSIKYKISGSTVSRVIRKLSKDCQEMT